MLARYCRHLHALVATVERSGKVGGARMWLEFCAPRRSLWIIDGIGSSCEVNWLIDGRWERDDIHDASGNVIRETTA
jgi:hypothetical protein